MYVELVGYQKLYDRMANSVDPDQTSPKEQSDLDLHCLLRYYCPNILVTVVKY